MSLPRVLIVEDDAGIGFALTRMFNHWGWSVTVAPTVAAAVLALSGPDHGFALIVLDMWLPDGDGSEVLAKVRHEGVKARVIVSTAHGPSGAEESAAVWKPDAVFPKPIDLDEFSAFVHSCREGL